MKATIFWWSRLQNQTVLCGGCSSTCRFYASKCHLRRHRWILTTLKKIEEETSHTKKSAKYITISPYHLFLPLFGGCYISRYISWYKYINIIHTHTYIYRRGHPRSRFMPLPADKQIAQNPHHSWGLSAYYSPKCIYTPRSKICLLLITV